MKKLVTKEFREKIREWLPNMKLEAHWELLNRAFFSPCICENTKAIRFSATEIAKCFNTSYNKSFKAGNKLKEFLAQLPEGVATLLLVDGKEWTHGRYENLGPQDVLNEETGMIETKNIYKKIADGFERRVLFNWPIHIQIALENEKNIKGDIYFTSGLKKNLVKERKILNDTIDNAMQEVEILDTPTAFDIADYLNHSPVNSFNQIEENADKAWNLIHSLPEHIRETQGRILAGILEQPKVVYKPSQNGNTCRLFGTGGNITNLKSEIRQALTNWDEADLKSCQLAIVAYLWGVEEVTTFLMTGRSFWNEIMTSIGMPYSGKGVIKDATYGIIYGQNPQNTSMMIEKYFPTYGYRFLNHPLIAALIKARSSIYRKAVKVGYMTDAFNKQHEVNKSNVLTVMSKIAQSYEQVLIHPIFELANTTTEFSIMLYMFDSVAIKFHNSARKDFWIKEIERVVNEKAMELGIITSLEWKKTNDRESGEVSTVVPSIICNVISYIDSDINGLENKDIENESSRNNSQ